jgi:hypothetical protein
VTESSDDCDVRARKKPNTGVSLFGQQERQELRCVKSVARKLAATMGRRERRFVRFPPKGKAAGSSDHFPRMRGSSESTHCASLYRQRSESLLACFK